MAELYAFVGSALVGAFTRSSSGEVAFEYESGAARLSLSMPRDGRHAPDAALNYLDNMLPDHQEVRDEWARERGLDGADPFTLLSAYGEDVAGAVSLSNNPELPTRGALPPIEATEEDIAERARILGRISSAWRDARSSPAWSLAGMQGKFALAKVGDQWFWPTHETPSTHIFKPPSREHKSIDRFESASLDLARSIGLPASSSGASTFMGQPSFVVERWDRAGGVRLPAEDMNQALGHPTSAKYDVGAPEIARLLDQHGQAMQFVRQLAFNSALGNADAHAKNYSVLLAGDRVELAPLYDAVPTHFWPKYSQRFAMRVGKAELPAHLTKANWRLFAVEAGLDPNAVCGEAFSIMSRVAERYLDVFEAAEADQARLSMIGRQVKRIRKAMGTGNR